MFIKRPLWWKRLSIISRTRSLSLWMSVSLFLQSLQLLLNRLKSKVALVSRIRVMQEFNMMDLTSPGLTYLVPLMNDHLAAGTNFEWLLPSVWDTVSGKPAINYAEFLSSLKGWQMIFLSGGYFAFLALQAVISITIWGITGCRI